MKMKLILDVLIVGMRRKDNHLIFFICGHIGMEEYCYCGAGFYKGIWETILGEQVRVEVLESVMMGGDVCKIAIHLPESITINNNP